MDKKTARQEFIGDDNDPNDWWYVHDDGVKRRVPSTFLFPMLGLEDMYVFWHCGAPAQKIPLMNFVCIKCIVLEAIQYESFRGPSSHDPP